MAPAPTASTPAARRPTPCGPAVSRTVDLAPGAGERRRWPTTSPRPPSSAFRPTPSTASAASPRPRPRRPSRASRVAVPTSRCRSSTRPSSCCSASVAAGAGRRGRGAPPAARARSRWSCPTPRACGSRRRACSTDAGRRPRRRSSRPLGVRVPDWPRAARALAALPFPLLASSANLSGGEDPAELAGRRPGRCAPRATCSSTRGRPVAYRQRCSISAACRPAGAFACCGPAPSAPPRSRHPRKPRNRLRH